MRSGRVIVATLAVALAAGAGAAVWRHAVPVPPFTGAAPVHPILSDVPGPTAQQEGDRPAAGKVTAPLPRPGDEAARRPPLSGPTPPEISRRPAEQHGAEHSTRPTAPSVDVRQQGRSSATQTARQAAPPDSGQPGARVASEPATGPAAGSAAPSGAPGSSGPGAAAGGEGTGGGSGAGATGSASGGAQEDASHPIARAPVVTPPRVISTGTMAYPGDAFRFTVRRQDLGAALAVVGTEGTVALRVLVLADGTVRDVDAVESSGARVLDRSAVEAVRRWQFAPATRDGAPIDAYVTLRIRYVVR